MMLQPLNTVLNIHFFTVCTHETRGHVTCIQFAWGFSFKLHLYRSRSMWVKQLFICHITKSCHMTKSCHVTERDIDFIAEIEGEKIMSA